MDHLEANEALGAYALDALDGSEHAAVDAHLAACSACRAELDGFHQVTAALGHSVEPLPEGLWARISTRLSARGQHDDVPPLPLLLERGRRHDQALSAAPSRRSLKRWKMATVALAGVAACIVAGLALTGSPQPTSPGQGATVPGSVVAALETPGHRLVTLRGADSRPVAQFVLADGRGYLVSSSLPTLGSGKTYQLWGVIENQPISLGLLGRNATSAAFTLAGSPTPTQLGVTVEPSGGSVVPTSAMVATGTV